MVLKGLRGECTKKEGQTVSSVPPFNTLIILKKSESLSVAILVLLATATGAKIIATYALLSSYGIWMSGLI